MAIRIGKKRMPKKDKNVVDGNKGVQPDPRRDGLLDPKASATISWKSIRDAVAAQNPDVDRRKLDDAIDSLIKDDKDYSYDKGFKECLGLSAMAYERMTGLSGARDDFMNTFLFIIKEREGKGMAEWIELYHRLCRKAWNEGAIHGFGKSGEGFNAEYPFDDGKDRSFEEIVTEDNPYNV